MYMDEVNETGHRRRQQPEAPGSDGFGGATRVGEGGGVKPKRADQLVLGGVGYDNHRRRKLQTIRELARSQASKERPFSRDRSSFSIHGNDFPPSDDFGCSSRPSFVVMDAIFFGYAPDYCSSFNGRVGSVGFIISPGAFAVRRLESRAGLDNFLW